MVQGTGWLAFAKLGTNPEAAPSAINVTPEQAQSAASAAPEPQVEPNAPQEAAAEIAPEPMVPELNGNPQLAEPAPDPKLYTGKRRGRPPGSFRAPSAPHPVMTPAAFTAWRERMGFSVSDAAREFEVSRNWIMKFESGESVIKRHIALACAAIEKGIPQAK